MLLESYVDFCIHSQGEQTFLELMRVLTHGGSLADIKGLIYKDGSEIKHNPHRPLIPLDDLPYYPYDKVPMERHLHKHYLGNRVGTHHSSYGCPFSCNFCAVVDMVNKRWLPESAERVAKIDQDAERPIRRRCRPISRHGFLRLRAAHGRVRRAHHWIWGMTWWALGARRHADALQRRHLGR